MIYKRTEFSKAALIVQTWHEYQDFKADTYVGIWSSSSSICSELYLFLLVVLGKQGYEITLKVNGHIIR